MVDDFFRLDDFVVHARNGGFARAPDIHFLSAGTADTKIHGDLDLAVSLQPNSAEVK